MDDFEYSEGIKGMEAVCAQMKIRLDQFIVTEDLTDMQKMYYRGYKDAYYAAVHATGTAKFHEKMTARKLAKAAETL